MQETCVLDSSVVQEAKSRAAHIYHARSVSHFESLQFHCRKINSCTPKWGQIGPTRSSKGGMRSSAEHPPLPRGVEVHAMNAIRS